ncbi:MAG: hypothetical protein ACXVW8_02495 [Nocardioidaceae bacterium]
MDVQITVVQHAEKQRTAGDPGLTDLGQDQAACWPGGCAPSRWTCWSPARCAGRWRPPHRSRR